MLTRIGNMKLDIGKLYRVVKEKYSYDDELIYFTDTYCVYNYCIIPGDLYDYHNDLHYMTDYNNVFVYIGYTRFSSTHNEEIYTFHKFLYGAKIIYFTYNSKYVEVK